MTYLLMAALIVAGALAAPADGAPATAAPQSCERLASLKLPNTTITLAQTIEAGAFRPSAPEEGGAASPAMVKAFGDLPAFCRVAATLKPSSDSDIKVEVWLPVSGWNGKFQGIGNGGYGGTIGLAELADAVSRGYASASTDTGHA